MIRRLFSGAYSEGDNHEKQTKSVDPDRMHDRVIGAADWKQPAEQNLQPLYNPCH